MKKQTVTKFLCFALVLVMTLPLFSSPAGAYISQEIALSRAMKYCERKVELTINDMKFTGKLHNSALTTEKFMDLVREAMTDMDLDESDLAELNRRIDKMLDNAKLSDADKLNLITAIIDMGGAAIPGIGGSAASLLSVIISILQDDAVGTGLGAGGMLPGKVGKGASFAGAGWRILNEWKKDQKKWKEMSDGLEAVRIMQYLYKRIDRLIEDFVKNNMDKNVLEFKGVKAGPKPFTLYGAPCEETWELIMTLNYKRQLTPKDGHFEGIYGGDFSIYIEYDVGNLPFFIRDMADVGQRFTQLVEPALGQFSIDVTDGSKAKRTLSGTAEAFVRINADGKVDFNKEKDEKRGTVVADFFSDKDMGRGANMTTSFTLEFALGDEDITLSMDSRTATLTAPDYYGQRSKGTVMGSVPIQGDIYKRGDTLSSAILKVLPDY